MPRYIRSFVPGATYFFTLAIADRSSDLLLREVDAFRNAYARTHARLPFRTIAICVLPDHLHAVWQLPPEDARYDLRWQQIKSCFSRSMPQPADLRPSLRARREKGIWQRRYWEHQIRDEDDLRRHVEYVHFNPVKHGLAERVRDWPFSSFHRWVQRGELAAEWGEARRADDTAGFGEPRAGGQAGACPPYGP